MTLLVPVILSGGAGSRLWPVSREGHPKPFMKLADGQTLLEKTYRRVSNLMGVNRVEGKCKTLTVTNRDYYFMSRDELMKAGVAGTFLLEPFGRNTAPAVAIAAHQLLENMGHDVVMLVLPSDHLIEDEMAFAESVQKACSLADDGYLVTFGIHPTFAETGFGYIQKANNIGAGFHVKRFVEKPDFISAQSYIDSGEYLWNSGMFCFKAKIFLEELEIHAPVVAKHAASCWAQVFKGCNDLAFFEIPDVAFLDFPNESIDYALMERSSKVAVVPGTFGWNDIGSWDAVRDLVQPNSENNRSVGEAIFYKSSNTYVQSEDRLVATVGVDNLMIIDTPDALLVAHPDFAQDIKIIVSELKDLDHNSIKFHKTVVRPWGTYKIVGEGAGFKIKQIEVRPGAQLSLQMHHHRSEHWVVVKGQATIINGDQKFLVKENESTYIPAGCHHRLENKSDQDLILVEVQCGNYLGEDDIVRFEDSYGRQ